MTSLIPANLAAFVLFFEPGIEWFEIFGHGAGGNIFAGRLLQDFAPIFGAAFLQNVVQPGPDLLVIGVVTGLRWLVQNFARDVVVQLELKHRRKRVVVIVGRVIVDVGLGRGVAEFLAARRRRFDSLHFANVFPPARIPLIGRKIVRVNVGFPMRHRSAGEINEGNGAGERVIEKERGHVGLEILWQDSA